MRYVRDMETVKVDLPAALLQAAKLDSANLSEDAARLLALELFREEKVSLGRAAELCHTPIAAFMDFAGRYAALGFTDLVFHHPRAEDPVWNEPTEIVEQIAAEVLPAVH